MKKMIIRQWRIIKHWHLVLYKRKTEDMLKGSLPYYCGRPLLVKQCLMTFLATMKIMTFSSIIPMHTNLRPEIFVICNNGTWSVCWDHNILLSHKFQLVAYPYNSPLLHFKIAKVTSQLLQAWFPLVFRLRWLYWSLFGKPLSNALFHEVFCVFLLGTKQESSLNQQHQACHTSPQNPDQIQFSGRNTHFSIVNVLHHFHACQSSSSNATVCCADSANSPSSMAYETGEDMERMSLWT